MNTAIKTTFNILKDIIFPLRCLICSHTQRQVVCDDCMKNICFIKTPCKACGLPLNNGNTNTLCLNCIYNPPLFNSARSMVTYNEYSKKLICRFKFCDAIHAGTFISQWLIKLASDILDESDLIIPVPLHRWKLFTRGYNQSSIISNLISGITKIPVDHLSLQKTLNTPAQSKISNINQRIQNVSRAFNVTNANNIRNKSIILIDDVITTGATIHACTTSLLKSGAKSVHVLTIARHEKPLVELYSRKITYKITETNNS